MTSFRFDRAFAGLRAARGGNPRCIRPAMHPAWTLRSALLPRSNSAAILPRRALPGGRLAALGAHAGFRHGLLALAVLANPLMAQPRPQEGGAPPTIEEKTASMELMEGFMPLYWEEATGKIWLEVGQWDTDVLHASGIGAGLGSNDIGIDRGQMAGSRVVRFHRVGPKVLMTQPNYRFRASSDNPAERKAVEDAFAPSTLWGFTVGAATGDRVLVDFTPFLMQDIAGFAGRMSPGTYRLDQSRSAVYLPMVMNFSENTEMEVSLTFVRQDGGGGRGFGGGGGGGFEGVANVAASGAAATIRMHHSFIKLPELGEYTPRAHDSRAGYGGMSYLDYSVGLGEPMTQRLIRRHRLEKRDPGAAMSEPVEPIIYYLDPGTPEPVRSALLEGARWWNQAFEAAGFIDGFQVELRPEDVSSHDVRYNVINWVHRSTRGWSTGGSISDPRTGEILKGNVTLGSLRVRQDYLIAEGLLAPYENGDEAATDISEWALARIRQLSAHEVGHTLGLSHNYYDSDAGRISVLDYPHPLITHDGSGFDYSQVYDTDIGEWDKVAIRFGYAVFPSGTDEAAELERILDEAWEDDVRFFSNQDVSAHARVDQWSNGTDAGAELDRMLDVRRAALERFGERAIRAGRPMAQMEEVLVPLYLHHRFQVTAAASVLGGMHYTYATRGDGLDPVRPAPAAEQRRALDALVRSVRPAELTIPESVLDDLPPRPAGYGRSRELFPRYTGLMFDAISPAVVATAHVVSEVLNPSRAARLLEQSALDPSLPGLGDVIRALTAAGEPNAGDSPYEAEVRRAVGRVVADGLMGLAGGAPMPQVRAVAAQHLGRLKATAASRSAGDDDAAAHFALLARDIQRFEDRPFEPWSPTVAPQAPPGAPIGSPAPDWIGDWTGSGNWTGWATSARAGSTGWSRTVAKPVDDHDPQNRVVVHPGQDIDSVLQGDRPRHEPGRLDEPGSHHPEHAVVLVRLQAVAAHHLQLPGDDAVHGDSRVAVFPGHESHLHVPPALAQAGDGVEASVRVTEGVQRCVGAAAGHVADLRGHVRRFGCVDDRRRTQLARQPQRVAADVHRDHVGAQRTRDHDRGQPHPAAAVHGDPVTPRDPALGLHRPERGREPAAEARGLHEADLVREGDQGQVGVAQRHTFGESAPAVKAWLELAVADLLVAAAARHAPPAPRDEGHRHAISPLPARHLSPHLLDHPGDLVPGHVGQHDVGIVAHPAVPVAPADPVRFDPHDHAVGRRLRIRQRFDCDRAPVLAVDCGSHGMTAMAAGPAAGTWFGRVPRSASAGF